MSVWAEIFLGVIAAATLALYAIVAPGAGTGGPIVWVGFAVSQAYLLARIWVRLLFFASEVALFQGRLAHAGYIASPRVRLPEPPIVEQIVGPAA